MTEVRFSQGSKQSVRRCVTVKVSAVMITNEIVRVVLMLENVTCPLCLLWCLSSKSASRFLFLSFNSAASFFLARNGGLFVC